MGTSRVDGNSLQLIRLTSQLHITHVRLRIPKLKCMNINNFHRRSKVLILNRTLKSLVVPSIERSRKQSFHEQIQNNFSFIAKKLNKLSIACYFVTMGSIFNINFIKVILIFIFISMKLFLSFFINIQLSKLWVHTQFQGKMYKQVSNRYIYVQVFISEFKS